MFSGLNAISREKIMEVIKKKEKLPAKYNAAVIHSVNYAIMLNFGKGRPSPELCR